MTLQYGLRNRYYWGNLQAEGKQKMSCELPTRAWAWLLDLPILACVVRWAKHEYGLVMFGGKHSAGYQEVQD